MKNVATLREVAPAKPSDICFEGEAVVWQLTLDQIESGTGAILHRNLAPASEAGNSTHPFDEGNVLYSKLRPNLNKVVCPNEPGISTTELVPLRPDPKRLDRRYLCYYLRSPRFVAWATQRVSGAKMPRVKMGLFWEHEIPLPPLAQQQRIAGLLDTASALWEKRARSERLLGDLPPSIFHDMFGSVAATTSKWPSVELGDVCISIETTDPTKTPNLEFTYIDIASIDTAEGRVESPQTLLGEDAPSRARQMVLAGDVLVSTVRPNLRQTAMVPKEHDGQVCSTGFAVLRAAPDKLDPLYLYTITRDPWFTNTLVSLTSGANYPAVRHRDVLSVRIPVPPITLQREFAKKAKAVHQLQDRMREAAKESDNLFHSLVQRAFKGEL